MTVTENYENYVKMPNYHLRDSRLSYKARGLFSVILNLPDDWHLTQKGLILISDKDGDSSVRSAIKELLDLGYLTRERVREKDGTLGEIQYHIHPNPDRQDDKNETVDTPEEEIQCENYCGKNVETVENNEPSMRKSPELRNPGMEQTTAAKSTDGKSSTINNIYNKLNYDKGLIDTRARRNELERETLMLKTQYHKLIMENIGYSALVQSFASQQEELDELVELMVDVLVADSDTRTTIGGKMIPTSLVKNRFLSLRQIHIEQVLLNLANNKCQVSNIHAYLLTCLYQSFTTASNQVAQQVNFNNRPQSQSTPAQKESMSAMEWAMSQIE
jgi:hypothetical protein